VPSSHLVGIHAFGGYVPPLRLSREEIAAAHAWVNPGLRSHGKGDRSVAGWDEDVVTMAVETARDCLSGYGREAIVGVFLGTTTPPFADRPSAGLVTAALGLAEEVSAQDVTGSQRAGTGALLIGLDGARARGGAYLVIASERRATPAATTAELTAGHGAACLVVGPGAGIAGLLGSASLTVDFVDHFRAQGAEFDYQWEERWVRDEGYLKIVPRAIAAALADAQVSPQEVKHFCLHCSIPRVDKQVARLAGFSEKSVVGNLAMGCGDIGAAHPVAMLVSALERASPGEIIVVAGFGQGSDVLVFRATEAIVAFRQKGTGIRKWLDRGRPVSYVRYLTLNGLLEVNRGIRAEADNGTGLSALYRHRDLVDRFVGGRCESCGTFQIPRTRICVNPDCGAVDSQKYHSFADSFGRIVSWSADNLIYTPDPPAYYGMVDFEEGGRLMLDFANIDRTQLSVGMRVQMVFRVKDYDSVRGFRRYFWKAAPIWSEQGEIDDGKRD
jgi:3-hydroxy-3-methylglutaryl CoA synthase